MKFIAALNYKIFQEFGIHRETVNATNEETTPS